jgi:hypothetical protein
LATDLGHGYTSNGKANTVTIFDLKTLKPLGELKTGKNPDSIIYDPSSKRVFAFNGSDKTATGHRCGGAESHWHHRTGRPAGIPGRRWSR